MKGKDGRDGKSSYTFTRYSDDGGKTFTKPVISPTPDVANGDNQLTYDQPYKSNGTGSSVNTFTDTKRGELPLGTSVGYHITAGGGNSGVYFYQDTRHRLLVGKTGTPLILSCYMRSVSGPANVLIGIENVGSTKFNSLTPQWERFEIKVKSDDKGHALIFYADSTCKFDLCCIQFAQGNGVDTWQPAPKDAQAGTTSGTYLGIASWDKPYPPLDPQMYQWSSTTDKEAMKKAQEAIRAAETANSAATNAATKANDATKRAGEVELKMQQGEFIVRADKTRFQNNKGQDVAVFNADGTINARAIMAKGTGGTAYFGLYNDAPAMIFTNASGQTTALMTNQGILKPADCVITLRDTKGSMLFKETNGTTIRAYFTYYIAIRVVNTGFQRTLFGDDTLSPHAQLSLSARFEEYAGSDMQLRCVEPKWIEPQKEQTIVYRATTDHLYPKRYLSAETEFRVSWYASFEGQVIVAGNFNAREAASKGEGYVSFDY